MRWSVIPSRQACENFVKAPEFRRLVEEEICAQGDRFATVLRKIEIDVDDDRRLFPTGGFVQLLQDPDTGTFLRCRSMTTSHSPWRYRQRLILGGRVGHGHQIGNVGEQSRDVRDDPRILNDDNSAQRARTYRPGGTRLGVINHFGIHEVELSIDGVLAHF